MRRAFAGFVLALIAVSAAQAQQRTVNVYNWSDYVEPSVIEAFTKETGIKVKYDTFDSNDTLETKLLAGKSGYDVVVPTAYFLERQIKAGVFQKLDKSKLANIGNLWPEITKRLAAYDPGNQFAVNYMWGTMGIGYNVKKVRDILGPDGKVDSWDIFFKPEMLARFKDCGVHVLDSSDDVMPNALNYLGLKPNSKEQADLEKAADLMMKVRPFIPQIPFVGVSERAGVGGNLSGAGLVRRHQAGAEARGGGEGGRRDRLRDPQGRRADVVRQSGDPEGCEERSRSARLHRLSFEARGRSEKLELHLVCQRQPRQPEAARQGAAERQDGLSGRGDAREPVHDHSARPAHAARDEPAVDED